MHFPFACFQLVFALCQIQLDAIDPNSKLICQPFRTEVYQLPGSAALEEHSLLLNRIGQLPVFIVTKTLSRSCFFLVLSNNLNLDRFT